jgi:hypothetical protein
MSMAIALATAAVAQRVLARTTSDKVFFIGPNKTGTSSISKLLRSLGYRPCHNICYRGAEDSVSWPTASRSKNWSYFEPFDVYSDNGNLADVVWLAKSFPTARFVLNVRPLKQWLLSRVDMYRHIRERGGCSPYGKFEAGNKCGNRGVANNDADACVRWVVLTAAAQEAALAFFQSSPALRNRFAVHDFVTATPTHEADTKALVDWITRPGLDADTTDKLVLSPADLPTRVKGTAIRFPRVFSYGTHSVESVRLVTRALEDNGCPESMHDDVLLARCAAAIMERRPAMRSGYEMTRTRDSLSHPHSHFKSRQRLNVTD